MTRKTHPLHSNTGASTPDRIVVYGHDLINDLLGSTSLSQMAFLALTGRRPNADESAVFDAITLTLVEHGMTPMAIASRLTILGAPESLQGAVAAGLLGMGDRFGGGAEAAADLLRSTLAGVDGKDIDTLAAHVVTEHMMAKRPVPGLGHHIHKPIDPRTPKLFDIAKSHGLAGRHVALMQALGREAEARTGRSLPVNATGAIGALCCELGLPKEAPRGITIMARSIGLVGHLIEESRAPIAREIWERAETEVNDAWFAGEKP
jgi:citrate synthase